VTLHFLADESCDFGVVRLLRTAGYEVTAIAEILPRADDKKVIKIALEKKSVLITEDKDFGQLVYAHGYGSVDTVLPVKHNVVHSSHQKTFPISRYRRLDVPVSA
jgi:predicted nuclease of predicted toxin-antitoxin system